MSASRSARAGGSDSKFFTTTKKGETHELRLELQSPNRDKKKDAVKKGETTERARDGVDAGVDVAEAVVCSEACNCCCDWSI
jgi:hypothetical protein